MGYFRFAEGTESTGRQFVVGLGSSGGPPATVHVSRHCLPAAKIS